MSSSWFCDARTIWGTIVILSLNSLSIGQDCVNYADVPSSPVISRLDVPYDVYGISTGEERVYVRHPAHLSAINLSDPLDPYIEWTVSREPSEPLGYMVVNGEYAYSIAGANVWILDISEGRVPEIVKVLDYPGEEHGMEICDDRATLAVSDNDLILLDVSSPTSPDIVGYLPGSNHRYYARITENAAFVTYYLGHPSYCWEVIGYDIFDPANPSVFGSFTFPGSPWHLLFLASNEKVVMGNYYDEISVIDVCNPTSSSLEWRDSSFNYAVSGEIYDAVLSGDIAYFALGDRVEVVDCSDYMVPRLLGWIDEPVDKIDIVNGHLVMLDDEELRLALLQCGDPASVMLESFAVEMVDHCAHVQWSTRGVAHVGIFQLTAKMSGSQWAVSYSEESPGSFVAEDQSVGSRSGNEVVYELRYRDDNQDWTLLAVETLPLDAACRRAHIDHIRPNPFNPQTTISFSVDHPTFVRLAVYDLTGRLVNLLTAAEYTVGSYSLDWEGVAMNGETVPSGTYLVQLQTEESVESRKILLTK